MRESLNGLERDKTREILKNRKGITLIALIITVIIMLILAGIAISAITGDGGLFKKTRNAADAYEQAAQSEAEQIKSLMNDIDSYLNKIPGDPITPSEPDAIDIATNESIKVGDFVNYSVTVDGVTYDKWKILHKDTNGHVEIVCYNGPKHVLGEMFNKTKCKSDYVNSIKILNDASTAYKNGTYGYSARHLGSNPSNSSIYATISTTYVKYYSDYGTISSNANYKYIEQTHHETDTDAIATFSGTIKFSGSSWLASRYVYADSGSSSFGVRYVNSDGSVTSNFLYGVDSRGTEGDNSGSHALAPVVSLQSGIKAIPGSGDGSENSPWELTL